MTPDNSSPARRNAGRSRGTTPLANLPLRTVSSGVDRGRSRRTGTDLERVSGEVVERRAQESVARPLADREQLDQPRVVFVERERPEWELAPEPSGVRWAMLGAYVFGVGLMLVVLLALVIGGVIDLHALRPPWLAGG
jgi:hypothetical protein